MTLPPPMPVYRRVAIIWVLFALLIAFAFLRGLIPVLRRWFGDWKSKPG